MSWPCRIAGGGVSINEAILSLFWNFRSLFFRNRSLFWNFLRSLEGDFPGWRWQGAVFSGKIRSVNLEPSAIPTVCAPGDTRMAQDGGRGSTLNLVHPILTAVRGATLLWKAYESSALRHPLSERQSLLSPAKESVLFSCLRPWAPPATLHRLPTHSATGNCLSLGGLFRFSAFSLPLLGGQGRKILTVDTPL